MQACMSLMGRRTEHGGIHELSQHSSAMQQNTNGALHTL